jgi:hypothetical protein
MFSPLGRPAMGVLFVHMKGGAAMRWTDYGLVSSWQERNIIHKCDEDLRKKQKEERLVLNRKLAELRRKYGRK